MSTTALRRLAHALAWTLGLGMSAAAFAQVSAEICGSLQNAYGPLDYRVTRGEPLRLVESAHFTSNVEAGLRGERGGIGGDLDYTLRAFPNHHRALLAIQRYEARIASIPKAYQLPRPPECYYERAVRWRPDDVVARMLYAQYLVKHKRPDEARHHLELVDSQAANNAFTQYNIGLIYLEANDYPNALKHAHKAYALGMPRTDLRERLVAAGHWRDPDPAPQAVGAVDGDSPAAASPPASGASGAR